MPIQSNEIMNCMIILAREANLKVSVVESVKAGVITGLATMLGGMIGGKDGITIGGAIGTMVANVAAEEFKPLHQVLRELSEETTAKLSSSMRHFLNSLDIFDVCTLLAVVAGNTAAKNVVLQGMIQNCRQHLEMQTITY